MLKHILFDVRFFDTEEGRKRSQKGLLWLLEALARWDEIYLRAHPETPKIYRSGVAYKTPEQFLRAEVPEVERLREILREHVARGPRAEALGILKQIADQLGGGEHFRDVPAILENGGGDCLPLSQKIIVRSKSTGLYELLALGELRHVYPSYEALSYSFEKARYEFRDILGFIDKGVKPVIKAHLSNGTDVVATADHKFWTLEGRAKRLSVRTMGEYTEAVRMSRSRRTGCTRILQAARIPVLGAVRPGSAEAYLAGIYAAEGHFADYQTTIAQHKPKVRAKIEEALAAVGTGFRYRSSNGETPGSGAYYALHGGAANPIVAMMREQGSNSFDMGLPQAFLSGDEKTLTRMVEGHGDGDAWRPSETSYKRPGVNDATSSDTLVEQLRFALLALGRPTYTYRYEDHQGAGDSPIWRLHEYAATDENSKLRKRREFVERELPGLTYGIVLDAVADGEAHVGCVEVDGNHNFVLADGTLVSNCDNLAAWRVAELRAGGVAARPYITWRRRDDGGMTYHAIVLHPDGSAEDPSLLLGMGGAAKARERTEEERKLRERARRARGSRLGRALARLFVPPEEPAPTVVDLDGEFDAAVDRFRARRDLAETVLGDSGLGPGFGQGIYYQPVYWADDAYEDFRPGPPTAFYEDIRLPGVVSPGSFARPALWQEGGGHFDREEDEDDDLWGEYPFRPVYRSGMRTFVARTLPRRGKGYV